MPNFTPQVTYNVPILQPAQPHEIEAKVDTNPIDINRAIHSMYSLRKAGLKEEKENAYNAGLNKYAMSLNQIAEGQRQGIYKQAEAERLTRQLDDEYLAGGFKAADLYKIRDHFDGGVRKLEESRQQKLSEADTEFRLKQVDAFREAYPAYKNKDRDIIEGKLDELAKMDEDFKYYSDMLSRGATERELQYAAAKRGDTATSLARANAELILEQMIADPQFNPSQMTQATVDTLRHNLTLGLQQKGLSYTDATAAATRAIENMGVQQYVNDIKQDADNNTEFVKKLNDNLTESGRAQLLSLPNMPLIVNIRNTALMDSIVTRAGNPVEKLGDQISQAAENPDVFVSGYRTQGAGSINDSEVFSQIYSANVKDRMYPVRKLAQQALVTSKTLADTIRNPFDLSGEDLEKNQTNNTNALDLLNGPDAVSQRDKAESFNDPVLQSTLKATNENINKLEGNSIAYDLIKSGNSPRTLLNSLQASRMRVDDEGYVRMVEGTNDVLQSLGDLLASNETGNQVNQLNQALEKYTPEQRKAVLNLASNGEIKSLAAGEKVWDTTNKSIKEQAAEMANKAGRVLMEWLSTASSENPEKNAKAINNMWTGSEQPAETDTIPLEYSTKVSNKTTIGGASLIPTGSVSSQALRDYADRLEASIQSVEQSGAKTEKGKLENDRRLVKEARLMANKIENEDSDGNPAKVDYKVEEDINRSIEKIEAKQEMLRKANMDDSEEYQRLSTIKARLYRALGEGDD